MYIALDRYDHIIVSVAETLSEVVDAISDDARERWKNDDGGMVEGHYAVFQLPEAVWRGMIEVRRTERAVEAAARKARMEQEQEERRAAEYKQREADERAELVRLKLKYEPVGKVYDVTVGLSSTPDTATKIALIKAFKHVVGLGLADAKFAVDDMIVGRLYVCSFVDHEEAIKRARELVTAHAGFTVDVKERG